MTYHQAPNRNDFLDTKLLISALFKKTFVH